LKTRKNSLVPVWLCYWPKSLPTYVPVFNKILRYLGELLSVVGTQYLTTFGNASVSAMLLNLPSKTQPVAK